MQKNWSDNELVIWLSNQITESSVFQLMSL